MSHVQLPSDLPRRRITVGEWHQMIEAGVFGEDEHIELIEGEIVAMPPQGEGHRYALQELTFHLVRMVGTEYRVFCQLPLTLGDLSEPEPDLAIVRAADAACGRGHPRDALLVVEVSDSSLRTDRQAKVPLYARNGIPEVWIVNVPQRVVEVYRDPDPSGVYRTLTTLTTAGVLQPLLLPDITLPVAQLF